MNRRSIAIRLFAALLVAVAGLVGTLLMIFSEGNASFLEKVALALLFIDFIASYVAASVIFVFLIHVRPKKVAREK